MGWEISHRITLPSTNQGQADNSQSMALAIDGNYLIVSKYGQANAAATPANQQVYWYQRKNDGSWELVHTARASDPEIGGRAGDQFGIGVSICGNDAIVGESQPTTSGPGRVHFYRRENDGEWRHKQTISGELTSGLFGLTVWLSKQYAIVGDVQFPAAATSTGAVYIYKKGNDGTWSFLQRIAGTRQSQALGGGVVRINDNYAIFADGATGEAGVLHYYGRNNGGTFEKISSIVYNTNSLSNTDANFSVGIDGNNIIASSGADTTNTASENTVSFFQRQNNALVKSLGTFSDPDFRTAFGSKNAIHGNFAVSVNRPADALVSSGTLTFYRKQNDGTWVIESTDTPDIGPTRLGMLGTFDGLDIYGNYVAVTAPFPTDVTTGTGQVLIYSRKY